MADLATFRTTRNVILFFTCNWTEAAIHGVSSGAGVRYLSDQKEYKNVKGNKISKKNSANNYVSMIK